MKITETQHDFKISVFPMVGKPYYLLYEHGETYGDLKDVLRPHINFVGAKKPARHQLILTDDNGVIFSDHTIVKDLRCNIFIKDVEWNPIQKAIIIKMSGENGKNMYVSERNTKDEMEALIWCLENIPVTRLEVHVNIISSIRHSTLQELVIISSVDIVALTDALSNNKTIERVRLQDNGLNADQMTDFLKMVGENTVITELIMYGNDYRIKDLADCLRVNTSLRALIIGYCDMLYNNDDNDALAQVLSFTSLKTLKLYTDTKNSGHTVKELSNSLQKRNIIHSILEIDHEINLKWPNPYLTF